MVRTALSMAALTGQPVSVRNVRGGIRKPGVSPVDLAIVQALARATDAQYNATLGDQVLLFHPRRPICPLNERIDLGSVAKGSQPGSAVIILLSLLTPLARAGGISLLRCRGGTHVPFAPTYEYFRLVTLPAYARAGIVALPSIDSAGYSPRGGGEISLEIEPSAISPFNFTRRGDLLRISAVVVTSELPPSTGTRGIQQLEQLAKKEGLEINTEHLSLRSSAPGAAVTISAHFETAFGGAQALGQRGKRMEEVVEEAFYDFIHWLNSEAGTDEFLADHLLIPAALAEGPCAYTTSRVTQTLTTILWVVKQFIPRRMTLKGSEGQPGEIVISD